MICDQSPHQWKFSLWSAKIFLRTGGFCKISPTYEIFLNTNCSHFFDAVIFPKRRWSFIVDSKRRKKFSSLFTEHFVFCRILWISLKNCKNHEKKLSASFWKEALVDSCYKRTAIDAKITKLLCDWSKKMWFSICKICIWEYSFFGINSQFLAKALFVAGHPCPCCILAWKEYCHIIRQNNE